MSVYLGVESRHPVSREDMDWRKSAGSDVGDTDICKLQLFWQRINLIAQLGEQK